MSSSGFTYLADLWGSSEKGYSNQMASGQLQGPLNVPQHRPPTQLTTMPQTMSSGAIANQDTISGPNSLSNPFVGGSSFSPLNTSSYTPPTPNFNPSAISYFGHPSGFPSGGDRNPESSTQVSMSRQEFHVNQLTGENTYLKNVVQQLAKQLEQAHQVLQASQEQQASNSPSSGSGGGKGGGGNDRQKVLIMSVLFGVSLLVMLYLFKQSRQK